MKQSLLVTKDTSMLPKYPQHPSSQMLEPRPARQPFRGTETTDDGMPEGTDTRTPGWTGPVKR